MLRELIYALNGYHGEVFCFDEKKKTVYVENNLPFIQSSEKAILNRLCILASYFIKFKTFVEETFDYSLQIPNTVTIKSFPGVYRRAFSRALGSYLQAYQAEMVVLERMVVEDECVGLSTIQARTQKFQIIFPVISNIIDNIVGNKMQGCVILDVLYRASRTGIVEVQEVVSKLLQICNVVFYKHLALWMIHGTLPNNLNNNNKNNNNNNNEDFFISVVELTDNGAGKNQEVKAKLKRVDKSKEIYEVNVGLLPSYISLRLAEKILFVGQSVVLFKNGRKDDHCSKGNVDDCLISEDKEIEFERDLGELSRLKEFDARPFENTVHNIRNYVAQQLYILIVEKSNLQSQLGKFKDFFLIGRGELFLTFIDQSQNLLRNPPNNATQYDVNLAFEHACRDVVVEDEHRRQFSLIIKAGETEKSKATTSSAPNHFLSGRRSGWSCLHMTASVDWPLHVIFTQPIIDKYDLLFSFLLLAKRIQHQLHHCWTLQRLSSKTNHVTASKRRLRNHMAFFVDNLLYYLQVDVVDSQYSVLQGKLSCHRDFEQILLAHETFLNAMLNQSFLQSKQIHGCLSSIFELCQAFYGLVVYSGEEDGNGNGGDDKDSILPRLKEIDETFRKQSSLLFEILSTNARCNNHLSLLLLRIDFNRYFSKLTV